MTGLTEWTHDLRHCYSPHVRGAQVNWNGHLLEAEECQHCHALLIPRSSTMTYIKVGNLVFMEKFVIVVRSFDIAWALFHYPTEQQSSWFKPGKSINSEHDVLSIINHNLGSIEIHATIFLDSLHFRDSVWGQLDLPANCTYDLYENNATSVDVLLTPDLEAHIQLILNWNPNGQARRFKCNIKHRKSEGSSEVSTMVLDISWRYTNFETLLKKLDAVVTSINSK